MINLSFWRHILTSRNEKELLRSCSKVILILGYFVFIYSMEFFHFSWEFKVTNISSAYLVLMFEKNMAGNQKVTVFQKRREIRWLKWVLAGITWQHYLILMTLCHLLLAVQCYFEIHLIREGSESLFCWNKHEFL